MAEDSKILFPHGGYRNLIVYKKSDIIYEATVLFCRRFLPQYGDRTVDQMTQAARSCKQNIAEGSSASGTSKETEIKLTNVARATLDELQEDYQDYLKSHGLTEWPLDDARIAEARELGRSMGDWENWKTYFHSAQPEEYCNYMKVVIMQEKFLLEKMIQRQERDFLQNGGIRERMHAARNVARSDNCETKIYQRLSSANSHKELQDIANNIRREIAQCSETIMQKRGWVNL